MTESYIFDLYGTLIDIHTDQTMPSLWERMAIHFSIYGADWKPAELKKAYYRICEEEAERLITSKIRYPEPDIARVFKRLYKEAPAFHMTERKAVIDEDWVYMTASMFRTISRKKLKLYPDTVPVLNELKKRGKKIYLLSNAQTIFTIPEMEMTGIYDYFDDIFISSDYGMKKPQKEFMEQLLEEYHINPDEALMIGNEIQSDCAPAAACGVPSVFLNTGHYPDEIIRKQIKDNLPAGYKPVIISDGRLSHLIDNTGGHHNA